MSTIIPIGADHAGFKMKSELIEYLQKKGYSVLDKGTYSEERSDYPDYGHAVAQQIEAAGGTLGILLCGSGNV